MSQEGEGEEQQQEEKEEDEEEEGDYSHIENSECKRGNDNGSFSAVKLTHGSEDRRTNRIAQDKQRGAQNDDLAALAKLLFHKGCCGREHGRGEGRSERVEYQDGGNI